MSHHLHQMMPILIYKSSRPFTFVKFLIFCSVKEKKIVGGAKKNIQEEIIKSKCGLAMEYIVTGGDGFSLTGNLEAQAHTRDCLGGFPTIGNWTR